MTRIGIIVGSIAQESVNRKVATVLPVLSEADGVEFEFLEFSDLPIYDYAQDANYPEVAVAWKDALASVDGVIIVTPEYSRSIPGGLKNALDWASRPWGQNSFNGKPVAVMGVSGGSTGTAMAQQHLRSILAHFDAPTMGQPETFFQFNPAAFGPDGSLHDEAQAGVLKAFVDSAVTYIHKHAQVTNAA